MTRSVTQGFFSSLNKFDLTEKNVLNLFWLSFLHQLVFGICVDSSAAHGKKSIELLRQQEGKKEKEEKIEREEERKGR